MSPLSSRDRVITALSHKEPDRVPADLGGSQNSTIHIDAYVRLLKYLEIEPRKPFSIRRVAQTVNEIEPILLDRLHVDCVGIGPGAPDHSRNMDLPNGDWQDEFGVVRRRPPSSSSYDLHRSPLSGQIGIEDVEAFAWPDPHDPGYTRGLNEKACFLYQHTDRALVGYLLYNIIHMAQYLRGFDNWFMDFVENPALSHALHKRCADLTIEVTRHFLEAVGEYVQIVMFSDDIAGQQGLMISPQKFRDIIKPQWERLFACIRQYTKAKLTLHCCGNITPILDDIVELGVDVIHPVQVSAKDMDSALLKEKYGDKLSFWGGIDTQYVLPYGSPEDVKKEVRRRIEDLAAGGGYLLGAVHTIQPDVPPENICAMFDTERWLR